MREKRIAVDRNVQQRAVTLWLPRRCVSACPLQTFQTDDGPPGSEAYVLNPGNSGLLCQIDTISAAVASTRPMPGRTTIAAHVDHVLSCLNLISRWAQGEENPWAGAD